MTSPIHATLDSVVATVLTASSSLATWMLMTTSHDAELKLLLLPLIGALIASGGMIMLNPTPETRRIVIGRAVFSLFLGTLTPQICALIFTSWAALLERPVILLGFGGVGSIFYYALSRPFTEKLYSRSGALADVALSIAEGVFAGQMRDAVTTAMDDKVKEAVHDPEVKQAAKEIIQDANKAAKDSELRKTHP